MDKLILLDSNSIINRAYYALPNLTNRQGQHTGAIYGFINMLLKIIGDYKPTHIVATFDRKAPTFRKQIYDQYKAQRKGMPDELASQLEPTKEILRAMNIPIVEMDGYEADDLIGTLAKKFCCPTYIVTGDRDSLQLIDDSTTILLTKSVKGVSEIINYDSKRLLEDGLKPSQIIDLKALMGDASDNIPGVPGVGEKTAMQLIEKYNTLDGVYDNIDQIKGKLQERLIDNKELAYLSYELATINTNSPIDFEFNQALLHMPFGNEVKEMFKKLEFSKLLNKLDFEQEEQENQNQDTEKIVIEEEIITNAQQLSKVVDDIKNKKIFALNIDKEVTLATSKTQGYVVEIAQTFLGEGISYDDFLNIIKEILEDKSIAKLVYDSKVYLHMLDEYNIKLENYQDLLLKAYLVDSNRNYKSATELVNSFGMIDGNISANLFNLNGIVDKEMQDKELVKLYNELELPLVKILFDMEKQGFGIDLAKLDEINAKITAEIDELSKDIIELAGGKPFNINSPKQLGVVLFEDLGLKYGKKTKTGYSTNVDVLMSLRDAHPIVDLVLRYRELAKLKGTYLDGIRPLVDSKSKIRTVFKQTVTATGRLSSTEPNLQNIPVRKPEGKQIREMFVAEKGHKLVCCDYSQIELRLMAVFSKDPTMLNAFKNNIDIHATTASQVMGIPLSQVTPEMRNHAKAVNFGIIYGISDFGLSSDLGIPVWQAKDFINKYFVKYPKVKEYMDNLIEIAKQKGYAETYLGRRRYIPELKSSNYSIRSFGERVAMNMPLQGSASDIIKLAMIKVEKNLKEQGLQAKLIMQVHDELIVDCIENQAEIVKKILKDSMESVVEFEIPLIAQSSVGDNWLEAK